MRLAGITSESVVDGPGLRLVIFAQGCQHRCPFCHNPESWETNAGKEFSVKQLIRALAKQKKNKRGITFSGGEPFLQAGEFARVAIAATEMNLDIVTYTGFTYEQLSESADEGIRALLTLSDILIDGQYVHQLRDTALKFRGSNNQRIIDIRATQKSGQVVLWEQQC